MPIGQSRTRKVVGMKRAVELDSARPRRGQWRPEDFKIDRVSEGETIDLRSGRLREGVASRLSRLVVHGTEPSCT